MAQNIYVNSAAQNPAEAFVYSELAPQPRAFPQLALGDNEPFNLYIVDGAGDFDPISGAGGYSVELLIGRLNESAVAAQSSWSGITNGWTASLDLDTVELLALFGNQEIVEAYAQVTITDPDAKPRTYGQQKVWLLNRVLTPGPGTPTPVVDYLTSAETFDRFVQNRSAITGLTGGGALNLDGIATVGKGPGWIVAVVISGVLNFYQLQSGTDAENPPAIVRPDDYNGVSNAKVWKLLPIAGADEVMRDVGNPNTLGKIGQYDWQPYVDTQTNEHWNWNTPTAEWFD